MDKVTISVSGNTFKFSRTILDKDKFEQHTLYKLCQESKAPGKPLELEVDRSSDSFAAILAYYQTDKLHMPLNMCPGQFKSELEYWGIDPNILEGCCLYRYFTFMDDIETHQSFRDAQKPHGPLVYTATATNIAQRARQRTWAIVDNQERSLLSTLYVSLLFFIVVVSIVAMAYSTEPYLRRSLTVCEYMEYLEATGHSAYGLVKKMFQHVNCKSGSNMDDSSFNMDLDNLMDNSLWQNLVSNYGIEEYDDDDDDGDDNPNTEDDSSSTTRPVSSTYSSSTLSTSGNVNTTTTEQVTDALDPSTTQPAGRRRRRSVTENSTKESGWSGSMPSLVDTLESLSSAQTARPPNRTPKPVGPLPTISAQHYVFDVIEYVVMAFFTVDFIIRVCTCPSFIRYFTNIVNFLDTCALVASFVHLCVTYVHVEERYSFDSWVQSLEAVQILRVLRIFRIVKNVRASKVLSFSVRQNSKDMLLLGLFLLLSISLYSNMLYFIEDRNTIVSIPQGWYWSVITLTTVGYGDISPQTGLGKFVACICAITGVLLLSITLPMFVNNFLTLYHYSCIDDSIEKKRNAVNKTTTQKQSYLRNFFLKQRVRRKVFTETKVTKENLPEKHDMPVVSE